jgi:hypothetical protein
MAAIHSQSGPNLPTWRPSTLKNDVIYYSRGKDKNPASTGYVTGIFRSNVSLSLPTFTVGKCVPFQVIE